MQCTERHIGQPGYPQRLAQVSDAPGRLEVRGQLLEGERAVVIVGARAADRTAVDAAFALAYELTKSGATVISGGALGVDAAAHRGALAAMVDASPGASGSTVAVLGCGLDIVYPAGHEQLFQDISEGGGALISQFARTSSPRSWYFARRNRTMAGMADAVVVIGAGAHSGALRTAHAARDYGRLVAAMPGSPGCEALIAGGAAVVRDAGELTLALAGTPVRPAVHLPEAQSSGLSILRILRRDEPRDVDDIARGTGLQVREITRTLTSLEMDGLVIPTPGLGYVTSALAHELLARRGFLG